MTPRDLPPPSVRTTDGDVGHSRSMPDNRIWITLSDGRAFVVNADRLQPQSDGTYLVALTTTDEMSITAR